MITIPVQQLPEVVPQSEIEAWKKTVRTDMPKLVKDTPPEVTSFIAALAEKMANVMYTVSLGHLAIEVNIHFVCFFL